MTPIGTSQTSESVRLESATSGNADIDQWLSQFAIFVSTRPRDPQVEKIEWSKLADARNP